MTLLLALAVQLSFAQEKTVKGVVSDASGPLPGVTVMVKGTHTGTQTDFDGKYTVKTKKEDVLFFSYIGMKPVYKKVGASNIINVTMHEDAEALGEIVLTGVAGATNRKKLSVTVNKVGKDVLETMPSTSAASALQGKVAGVTVTNLGQPGQGANIQLRGATNLFGSQTPLILIDGVISEGGLADINTDDIESFEIVKGASASALYGSRAGNGVIVITTKKGKVGKVLVTLKSEVGFSQLTGGVDLSKSHQYELADDWENYKGKFTKYKGVGYPSNFNGSNYQNTTGGRDVKADGYQDNPFGVYNDPQDAFFKTGHDNTLYASVATASEKSNIFFSFDKTENQGVISETKGYNRYGSRLNADFKINDWLTFKTRSNFIRSIDNSPGGSGSTSHLFFNALKISPDVNLYAKNADGQKYLLVPDMFESNNTNALYALYKNSRKEVTNKFLGSYSLDFKINKALKFETEFSLESINSVYESVEPYDTYTTGGEKVNQYATYNKGSLYRSTFRNLSQKFQNTLSYKESFSDLNVLAKLSFLLESYSYDSFSGRGNKFIYPDGVVSLDNFAPENTFVSSDKTSEVAKNLYAIVGLDYKDRYIVDGMYRYDGSSLFGSNHRWNSYYRFSGAYRISKDVNIPGVQELKVHAAYGTAGQRPGYDWQYDVVEIEEGTLSTDRTKANPDLRPSTTKELEFGLSTSFLNRFDLEVAYSKAKTVDQFMKVDVFAPANGGANKQWQNIGTVDFNTIEASLRAKVVNKDHFKWNTSVTFEKTTNKIAKLNIDPIFVGPNSQDAEIFRIEEGVEFGTMYGNKFVKNLDEMSKQLPTGKSIEDYVVNSDGVVVEKATIGTENESPQLLKNADGSLYLGSIGSQTPDFKLGLSNTITYKGFTFYTLFDWKSGGDIYNKTGQWLTRDDRHAMVDQRNKAQADKKHVNYYQGLYNVSKPTDFWVEDGSYVKLREASLFYTLGEEQMANISNGFFKSLRVGITGKNLLTFTKYSGWDPEVQSYGSATKQYFSYDYAAYPLFSSYSLSLTLKF